MATRASIAARLDTAFQRLQNTVGELAEKHGVPVPPPVAFPYRQPELRQAAELERLADFHDLLLGRKPTQPEGVNEQSGDEVDGPVEPTGDESPGDSDEGDTPDEPLFHGKPLSFYDGKSDQEIIDIKGIGPKTLEEIRAAQKKAGRK
jgi:hypothetical protein